MHIQELREAQERSCQRMRVKHARTHVIKVLAIGDVVLVAIPKEDRPSSLSPLRFIGVIMDIRHEHSFQIQTSYGIIERWFTQNDLQTLPGRMRPDDLDSLIAQTIVNLRTAAFKDAEALGVR